MAVMIDGIKALAPDIPSFCKIFSTVACSSSIVKLARKRGGMVFSSSFKCSVYDLYCTHKIDRKMALRLCAKMGQKRVSNNA